MAAEQEETKIDVTTIITAIVAYLTSLWSVARMVFGVLPTQVMEDCFGILCVVFLIYVIDSLPSMISRKKKEKDDEYILVRKPKEAS